jgi:phosphoglycerate kinase
VNEAFAVSHREHASIVGVPKFLPHALGMRLEKEIEMLSKVIENPEHPTLILISGIKDDKLQMVSNMQVLFDTVLVAGRLPEYVEKLEAETGKFPYNENVRVAKLNPDKEDITINSIEKFEVEIGLAKSIVLAGVIGKVEDEGHQQGTKRVFEAVARAQAYKVAGGGDTEAALTKFGLTDQFTWISVGGGAMLEYLANKTLPGIESLT